MDEKKILTYQELEKMYKVMNRICAGKIDSQESERAVRTIANQRNSPVIHVPYHGHLLSWIPMLGIACQILCSQGAGQRTPFIVFDKFLYNIPFFHKIIQVFCNSEFVQNYKELKSIIESKKYTDFIISPEGRNSFFSDGRTVQKFVSNRFIQLAIEYNLVIVLHVWIGAENHFYPLKLNKFSRFLFHRAPFFDDNILLQQDNFKIPILKKMPLMKMKSEIYTPTLKVEELSSNPKELFWQMECEGQKIRQYMQSMLDSLASPGFCGGP